MQYNKYAFALVLLASSAFASVAVTEPNYVELSAAVLTALNGSKTFFKITDEAKSTLASKLTSEQLDAFEKNNNEELDDGKIKAILEEVYKKEVEKIEKTADDILAKANGTKISGKEASEYDALLTPDQYNLIAEYEYKADKEIVKDEIVAVLAGKSVPTFPNSPADVAARILKLAGNVKKISETRHENYKFDINDGQFGAIKTVEDAAERPLTVDELTAYLTDFNFKSLNDVDKVKIIMKLSENSNVGALTNLSQFVNDKQFEIIKLSEELKGARLDDAGLEEILKIVDDGALDAKITTITNELTEANKVKSDVVDAKPVDAKAVDAKAVDAKPVDAKADAAKAGVDAKAADAKPADAPAVNENAKSILALVGGDAKLSTLKDDEFKNLATAEQIVAIKAKEDETGKRITEQELLVILNATPISKSAAEITAEQARKLKEEEDKKMKETNNALVTSIKAALKDNQNFSELTDDVIKTLKLTDKQIEALKNAKVTKESKEDDILKFLETTTAPDSVNGTGISSNITEETPFYQNKLFIGAVVVLALASIGGGVYMMTSKSEETDL